MRKYFLIFGLGLTCLLTSSVFANGMAYVSHRPCYAIPGWVIGADAGWGYLETPKDNLAFFYRIYTDLSQSHNIGDFVWGAHAGRTFGISPNVLLGFEVGYKDLGRSKYKSTSVVTNYFDLSRKVEQQAVDALLTSNYFVWKGLNLFAKAGMAYVGSTTKQTFYSSKMRPNAVPYYNTKKSIWRLRPEVIFGIGYIFNNFDFHILYNYIYGVSETKWGTYGSDYKIRDYNPVPSKPRTYGANLVMGGISYVFADSNLHALHQPISGEKSGWVVGADIGWGYLDTPADNLVFSAHGHQPPYTKNLSQSHDIGDIVWGVHGGHTFNITPNMLLGFEVGYKDLGRSKYKSSGEEWCDISVGPFDLSRRVDQQAIDILLTGNYFIWRGLNLFSKVGMAYVGSTTKQTFDTTAMPSEYVPYFNTKKSTWDSRPEVVLGIGYLFNKNIDVHVLYDYIYGVSETKWGGRDSSDYWWGSIAPYPPKPRTYGANLVMGGISYTF